MNKATFGAGCFWHVEAEFSKIKGVKSTSVGFMGGDIADPSYERVCQGDTGHVEVVQLEFDPKVVSFEKLLTTFWESHDPTQKDGQGVDIGTQYRSVIFYHDQKQKESALRSKRDLEDSGEYERDIATSIEKAGQFYKAEEYHQKYFQKKGISSCPM